MPGAFQTSRKIMYATPGLDTRTFPLLGVRFTPSVHVQQLSRRAFSSDDPFSTAPDQSADTTTRPSNVIREVSLLPSKNRPDPMKKTTEQSKYLLTILTGNHIHQRMADLAVQLHPPNLNKAPPRITLHHALPEAKLESTIIPAILDLCAETRPFSFKPCAAGTIGTTGVALFIPPTQGGVQIAQLHQQLCDSWKDQKWLSRRDRFDTRAHYTLLNRESDLEKRAEALRELKKILGREKVLPRGTAEGLSLWLLDRGKRRWIRDFPFKGSSDE